MSTISYIRVTVDYLVPSGSVLIADVAPSDWEYSMSGFVDENYANVATLPRLTHYSGSTAWTLTEGTYNTSVAASSDIAAGTTAVFAITTPVSAFGVAWESVFTATTGVKIECLDDTLTVVARGTVGNGTEFLYADAYVYIFDDVSTATAISYPSAIAISPSERGKWYSLQCNGATITAYLRAWGASAAVANTDAHLYTSTGEYVTNLSALSASGGYHVDIVGIDTYYLFVGYPAYAALPGFLIGQHEQTTDRTSVVRPSNAILSISDSTAGIQGLQTTLTPASSSSRVIAGYDYRKYVLSSSATDTYDDTWFLRITNYDGTKITIQAPSYVDSNTSTVYGRIRLDASSYATELYLTYQGEWIDLAYDTNAHSFAITGRSVAPPWGGAITYEPAADVFIPIDPSTDSIGTFIPYAGYMSAHTSGSRACYCTAYGDLLATNDTRFTRVYDAETSVSGSPNLRVTTDAVYQVNLTLEVALRTASLPQTLLQGPITAYVFAGGYPLTEILRATMDPTDVPNSTYVPEGNAIAVDYYMRITLTATAVAKLSVGDDIYVTIDNPYVNSRVADDILLILKCHLSFIDMPDTVTILNTVTEV